VDYFIPNQEIVEEQVEYDEEEEMRKMRQELAKQTRFDIKNFSQLRTTDDYSRGILLNRNKVLYVHF
jgi:hypothetical protein